MAKPIKKSAAFADWVRNARIKLNDGGINKSELAKIAGLRQEEISRIEGLGWVPSEDKLVRLCEALQKPVSEAHALFLGATFDSRAHLYETEQIAFTSSLIDRSAITDEYNPLRIYVIREDNEPINEANLNWYYHLLAASTHLRLTILFRYSDMKDWESFQWLAGELSRKWLRDGLDLKSLQTKLAGFYKNPICEEDRHASLPLGCASILTLDAAGPQLQIYMSDDRMLRKEKLAGHREDYARQRSMRIIPAQDAKAAAVADWIGANLICGLGSSRWISIEWPTLSTKDERLEI